MDYKHVMVGLDEKVLASNRQHYVMDQEQFNNLRSDDGEWADTYGKKMIKYVEFSDHKKAISALKEIANNGVEFETNEGSYVVDSNPVQVAQDCLNDLAKF